MNLAVPRRPIEIIGGFESTYMPRHDRDVAETTAHHLKWQEDLDLLRASGVTRLRYPVRWHRVEPEPGRFEWAATDAVMAYMAERQMRPIIDLVHHTSYPRWLTGGFADPAFHRSYLRYAEAFARRYPWVEEYTLFNEPFSTLFLAGHEAIWPPYLSGVEGFVKLIGNVLPAVAQASHLYRELLPHARHVWVDTCEHHTGSTPDGARYAAMANDRRFFVIDLFLGRALDVDSAFLPLVLDAGGAPLLRLEPGFIDVLGLDYYAHCQWNFTDAHGQGSVPTPTPLPLHEQIAEYAQRYHLPCMVTETNIRGHASDKASWLKYTIEQCEMARDRGVDIEGLCWFPFIDSADWDSLLFRCEGNIDPVGVYWLDEDLRRRPSVMSEAFRLAATGAPSTQLPAYVLAEPVATWLRGYAPQMAHWQWQSAPREQGNNTTPAEAKFELRVVDAG